MADTEAAVRADALRHARLVRLGAWMLARIPVAVALGVSMGVWGAEPRKTLRKFTESHLLKEAPDYEPGEAEGDGQEGDDEGE